MTKKQHITYEELHNLFNYKDGRLYYKNSKKRIAANMIAGYIALMRKHFRIMVSINKKAYYNSRLVFLFHKGYLPEFVDHEDRDTLNDNIENLRPATHSENNSNRKTWDNKSSVYLGVSLYKNAKNNRKWSANIGHNSKLKYIGRFESEELAALAYNRAAVKYHKEFANLNIIKP